MSLLGLYRPQCGFTGTVRLCVVWVMVGKVGQKRGSVQHVRVIWFQRYHTDVFGGNEA